MLSPASTGSAASQRRLAFLIFLCVLPRHACTSVSLSLLSLSICSYAMYTLTWKGARLKRSLTFLRIPMGLSLEKLHAVALPCSRGRQKARRSREGLSGNVREGQREWLFTPRRVCTLRVSRLLCRVAMDRQLLMWDISKSTTKPVKSISYRLEEEDFPY